MANQEVPIYDTAEQAMQASTIRFNNAAADRSALPFAINRYYAQPYGGAVTLVFGSALAVPSSDGKFHAASNAAGAFLMDRTLAVGLIANLQKILAVTAEELDEARKSVQSVTFTSRK